MAHDTRSSRKIKDDENNNSNGRQISSKGLSTSGSGASDTSGLRRSSRETSLKKNITLSPSSTRKSERLEKKMPETPLFKRKSERFEKKLTPSPLRRSDRAKNHSSTSSGSKRSDKSSGSSLAKRKTEKKEKSVKELTLGTREVSKSEKQNVGPCHGKNKIRNARAYKKLFTKHRKKLQARDHSEKQSRQNKVSQGGSNACGSEIEGLGKGVEELNEEFVGRVHDGSLVGSDSSVNKLTKETWEDNPGVDLSHSSPRPSCLEEASKFKDGDGLEIRDQRPLSSSYNAMTEELNDAPKRVHVECSAMEKLKMPELTCSTFNERLHDVFIASEIGHRVIPSKRKRNVADGDSDSPVNASKDVCTLTADAVSLLPSGSTEDVSVETCGACFKRQRVENDPMNLEFCSCSTKLNQELCGASVTEMSDLIRRGRSMTTAPSLDPPAQSASAATAPALLDHVVVGPGASQAPASSASFVAQPASARRRHRPTDTIDATSTDGTGASGSQPAKKNTRGPCRQLKTAKVTRVTNSRISIGYDERHRAAPTAELHSSLAHDIGHVVRTHCPMQWKSWRVMPDEIKVEVRCQLSTNYNLEDLDEESLTYVNRLFAERYKQWKSDLHHHFQAFDDPQVALQEGCPKELEGREDSWDWLCAHFQAPEFANKAQVNKGNRKKKTLLHHSGSRPFSYRMDARRREGSKFPEIDVFGDVYVRPGNELAESLHTTMVERSQLVLQESASQLPPETPIESVAPPHDVGFQILTETLDQTLGRRPGTYCRGMGNARRREPRPRSSAQSNSLVTALTAQVAELQRQMSVILQSLAQGGFPIPQFRASTSQPVHPEHAHQTTASVDAQTTAPVDAQTSEPHTGDDPVDFA